MAIRQIQDLGGLGQLANTILRTREGERAQSLQDAQLARQAQDDELRRRVQESQLATAQDTAARATQQREVGQNLAALLGDQTPADGVGPVQSPEAIRGRAADVASQSPAALSDLANFLTVQTAQQTSPLTFADKAKITADEKIRVQEAKPGTVKTPQKAINPATGKSEFVRFDANGTPQFLGVEPVPSKGQTINVGGATVEKAFDKALGTDLATTFTDTQKALAENRESDIRRNQARKLIEGVNTGVLAPTGQAIKRIIKGLGGDPEALGLTDDVGLAEALNAISVDFALEAVNKTKGAVSEREMSLFQDTAPQLSSTVEGNRLLLDLRDRMSDLQKQEAKLQRDYIKENKRLDSGYFEFRENFWNENPLFTPELQQRAQTVAVQPAAAQAEPTGRTATNPQTGQKVQELSDGQWIPVR